MFAQSLGIILLLSPHDLYRFPPKELVQSVLCLNIEHQEYWNAQLLGYPSRVCIARDNLNRLKYKYEVWSYLSNAHDESICGTEDSILYWLEQLRNTIGDNNYFVGNLPYPYLD